MAIKDYIEQLQSQPYEKRVRALWTATFAIGAVVVLVWGALTIWGPKSKNNDSGSFFGNLQAQYQKAKDQFGKDSQVNQTALSASQKPVTVSSVEAYRESELLVRFTVTNPTDELLVFLNTDSSNVKLISGNTSSSQNSLVTEAGVRFPSKILSGQTISGLLLFPKTEEGYGNLVISDMYYEGQNPTPFSQEVSLDEIIMKVKNESELLPRQ